MRLYVSSRHLRQGQRLDYKFITTSPWQQPVGIEKSARGRARPRLRYGDHGRQGRWVLQGMGIMDVCTHRDMPKEPSREMVCVQMKQEEKDGFRRLNYQVNLPFMENLHDCVEISNYW